MRAGSITRTVTLFRAAGLCLALGFALAACQGETGTKAALTAMSPQQRVDAAYEAMGGEAVPGLKTISLKAHIGQWDPGSSYSVDTPDLPSINSSELVQIRDIENGLVRNQWDRPKADDGTRRVYYEIITPSAGWSVGNSAVNGRTPKRAIMVDGKPAQTFSGRRLTVALRELERVNIVREMKAHPDRVSAIEDQTVDGATYPSVGYQSDVGNFIVMFDSATHLPARVRTPDWDAVEGDSVFDAAFYDWRDIAGVKVPFRTFYTLNGMSIADVTYRDVVANPQIPAGTFDIPAEQLAAAAKPADPKITPFHWAIRRQFTGFYFDSDDMYEDDGLKFTLVDIGPGISETQGGTHNTVFIDAGNYLIVMEAPNDDGQAIPSIALAKERYPGKPIRYLVLTHHHVDHVGGMRTYAAEGATIVMAAGNADYFRKVLARPQTLNWNAPANPKMPEIIAVTDKWTAPDTTREISFHVLDNPHAANTLMGWIPDQKLGLVTDIWNPGPPVRTSNPNIASIVHGVEKLGLQPAKFAGGHGTVGDYAQAAAVVHAAERATR